MAMEQKLTRQEEFTLPSSEFPGSRLPEMRFWRKEGFRDSMEHGAERPQTCLGTHKHKGVTLRIKI